MKTVHEVSRLARVSVRTLHHYDAIGLLRPACVTDAGYRMYDDRSLERLQQILIFRELRFSLKEIKAILDHPDFDRSRALSRQIELLTMERRRLDEIIALARQIQKTGVNDMDFSPFDRTQIDDYAAQAKAAWGETDAWKEYEQKTTGKTRKELSEAGDDLMDLFRVLGALRHLSPENPDVQSAVGSLRSFITEHYYTCTPQILRSLGQMYAAGGSMTENIDAAGGAGTAEFACRAIEIYCREH